MTIGIVANTEKNTVFEMVPKLLSWLADKGVKCVVHEELGKRLGSCEPESIVPRDEIGQHADIIASLGGDGTILATSRYLGNTEIPILGINLGKLGFLAEVSPSGLFDAMEKVLKGDYSLESRMVLEGRLLETGKTFFALNDIIVGKGAVARVMKIRTELDGEYFAKYISDGLIVATPTGSTAYSLSANGPILAPNVEALIINPICPHSLTARPVVVNKDHVIRITVRDADQYLVTADGQVEINARGKEALEIRKAAHNVQLIRCSHKSYYDLLRQKLNWAEDIRNG